MRLLLIAIGLKFWWWRVLAVSLTSSYPSSSSPLPVLVGSSRRNFWFSFFSLCVALVYSSSCCSTSLITFTMYRTNSSLSHVTFSISLLRCSADSEACLLPDCSDYLCTSVALLACRQAFGQRCPCNREWRHFDNWCWVYFHLIFYINSSPSSESDHACMHQVA